MTKQKKNRSDINKKIARAKHYPKNIPNRLAACLYFAFLTLALPAMAQLPGMGAEPGTESRVSDTGETEVAPQSIAEQ